MLITDEWVVVVVMLVDTFVVDYYYRATSSSTSSSLLRFLHTSLITDDLEFLEPVLEGKDPRNIPQIC